MGKKIGTVLCCLVVGVAVGAAGIVGASVLLGFDLGGLLSFGQEYVTLPQSGEFFKVTASSGNPSQVKSGDTYRWTVTLEEGYDKFAPKVTFKDSADKEITPVNFIEGDVVDGEVMYSFKVTQATKIEIEPQRNKYAVAVPSEFVQNGYTFEGEAMQVGHGEDYTFKVVLDEDYNLNALTVCANGVAISDVVNNNEKTITINEDTVISVDVLVRNTYRVTRPEKDAGFTVVNASHGTNVTGLGHGTAYSWTVQLEEGYLETAPVFAGTTVGVVPVLDEELSEPATGKYVYSFDVTQNTELKITAVMDGTTFVDYDNYDVIWPVGVKPVLIEAGATIDEVQAAFDEVAARDIPFEEKWVAFENTGEDDGTTLYEFSKTLVIPGINISGNNVKLRFRLDENGSFDHRGMAACVVNKGWYDFWSFRTDAERAIITETFMINKVVFENYSDVVGKAQVPDALSRWGRFRDSKVIDCSFIFTVSEEVRDAYLKRADVPFDAYCSYDGLTLKGCTFENKTDSFAGGVWIRNFFGVIDAKNVLIEDCVFNKRNGDEVLAIWSNKNTRSLSNVIVRNNVFNFYKSEHVIIHPEEGELYTNPVYFFTFGGGEAGEGITQDILFTGNKIRADNAKTLIGISHDSGSDDTCVRRVTIEDNDFEITGLVPASINEATQRPFVTPLIIEFGATSENCVIRNNTFSINTQDEKIKRECFVTGKNLDVVNNKIYGNGFRFAADGLYRFEGNYVEKCETGGNRVDYFINNTIDSCTSAFYRSLNIYSRVADGKRSVVRGNIFRAAKNVSMSAVFQSGSYMDTVFEYNTFYSFTQNPDAPQSCFFNVWNQVDSTLTFVGNTFYINAARNLSFGLGGGDTVISEFIGNRLLNAVGVDLLHDISPAQASSELLNAAPVDSTVSFKVKKGTQTGWVKTASGWELWTEV